MNSVYLGEYTALAKTIYGRKILVDTRDRSLAPHLLLDGNWEPWITEVLQQVVRGTVFVDVGANFGWYSLLASDAKARKIHSYEPNPRLFRLLTQTLQINGVTAELHNQAVGDENTKLSLPVTWSDIGGASLLGAHQGESPEHTEFQVDVVRLDDAAIEKGAPLTLKVDVEGFEPRVILGAKELISAAEHCLCFVEYHADPAGVCKLKEMLDFFQQNRFSLGHVTQDAQITPIRASELATLRDAEMLSFRKVQR